MKTLNYLWTLLFAVVMSVGLAACDEDDENVNAPQELYGTWYYYGDAITFNPDGTGTWAYSDGERETYSYSYDAGNGVLIISAYGETEQLRIVSLTSDTLVLEDSYGDTMTLRRNISDGDLDPDYGEQGGGETAPPAGDEDFDMSAPSDLLPVADLYPEISGKYQVSNTESGISSIEMMGNGHYLLRKAPTYYSKKMNAAKKEALTKGIYHDTSIETEDLIYGCFTKLSDMQYELDGFGTLQVARRDAQNVVVDIVLTDYTGTSIELNVNLEETVGELMTGNTALLCGRFWQLVKDQCTVWVNDKLGFNGIYYAEEDRVSVLVNDIMASPDYFFDFGDETTMEAFFSPFGTAVFFNRDGSAGVSLWRWGNESEGTIYMYDVYEGTEEGGNSQLAFSEDRMTITSSYSYNGQSESYVTLCKALD